MISPLKHLWTAPMNGSQSRAMSNDCRKSRKRQSLLNFDVKLTKIPRNSYKNSNGLWSFRPYLPQIHNINHVQTRLSRQIKLWPPTNDLFKAIQNENRFHLRWNFHRLNGELRNNQKHERRDDRVAFNGPSSQWPEKMILTRLHLTLSKHLEVMLLHIIDKTITDS